MAATQVGHTRLPTLGPCGRVSNKANSIARNRLGSAIGSEKPVGRTEQPLDQPFDQALDRPLDQNGVVGFASQQPYATPVAKPAFGSDLALYELQKPLVEPLLRAFRLSNTALDFLFYDVAAFSATMFALGVSVDTRPALPGDTAAGRSGASSHLDLGAWSNPEGSILVVDAAEPPHVQRFADMTEFLDYASGDSGERLCTISITGVGSSALGAAAFAWNASQVLREPVAAIVPGYGLADLVPQVLGGFLGFGLHDFLQSTTQSFLAAAAPSLAQMGRSLARSSPRHARAANGAPVFEHGSAASDDLHGLLLDAHRITRVIGHSKGALAIENALRSLPDGRRRGISVLTLGCAIAEEFTHCGYAQFLGILDGLGLINSWGHLPERWPLAHHSTNSFIPLSLPVQALVEDGLAICAARA
jgi:hypothetical protein